MICPKHDMQLNKGKYGYYCKRCAHIDSVAKAKANRTQINQYGIDEV